MKVHELITILQGFDPEAIVNRYDYSNGWGEGSRMNQQAFGQFFQKPEGFMWSESLQCYYEHQDFRFKYALGSIGEFNLKWQGWLAAQQCNTL